jgi:hypothetical protein
LQTWRIQYIIGARPRLRGGAIEGGTAVNIKLTPAKWQYDKLPAVLQCANEALCICLPNLPQALFTLDNGPLIGEMGCNYPEIIAFEQSTRNLNGIKSNRIIDIFIVLTIWSDQMVGPQIDSCRVPVYIFRIWFNIRGVVDSSEHCSFKDRGELHPVFAPNR